MKNLLSGLVWSVFPAWGQSRSFAELCQVDEERRVARGRGAY
jgi:hypothetical protein